MLVDDTVTGFTSNPTIFAKATFGSADYDEQLRALVDAGASVEETYVLVTEDIEAACDIFDETWQESDGWHGFVSVEDSPEVASDSRATIAEARE